MSELLQNTGQTSYMLTFVWISGHEGVRSREGSDELAKKGAEGRTSTFLQLWSEALLYKCASLNGKRGKWIFTRRVGSHYWGRIP